MCLIRLENVSKIYVSGEEKVAAVSGLSLEVESGEFVAVTGPSGCGKSTLLHMIGGLSRPSSGNISVRGKSLYQRTQSGLAQYRRRYVGIVYQFYNLVPELILAQENGSGENWEGALTISREKRLESGEEVSVAEIYYGIGKDSVLIWREGAEQD